MVKWIPLILIFLLSTSDLFGAELEKTAPAQNYIFRHEIIPPKNQSGLLEIGATIYSNFVNFGALVAELYKDEDKINQFTTGKKPSIREKHPHRVPVRDPDPFRLDPKDH